MNQKLTRTIAFAAAAMLVVSAAGCTEKKKSDPNEKMTISWLGIPWYGTAKEDGYAEKLLEDKYNIEISPIFYDQKGYADKKSVTMLGGTVPDLIYELDPVNVQSDVKQGFIQEIPYEKIKEKAPDYYAFINENCPEAWIYSNVDGKNYGLPNLDYNGKTPSGAGIWRSDWLEKVGITKTPQTIDEFHDALYKFRHNDPDGNGKQDTYGMTGDVTTWNMMFTEFFGAYGANPFSWVEKNGKIEYGGLQSNVKDALATLATWYKEGIIHPDFISDNIYSPSKFQNGEIGYLAHFGAADINDKDKATSMINKVQEVNTAATIENAYLPMGPDGKTGKFTWGYPAHVTAFGRNCSEEKVDFLLEMINDMITDEELNFKLHLGEEGMWQYKDESVGLESGVEPTAEWKDRMAENGMNITATQFVFFCPAGSTFDMSKKYIEARTKEYREQYKLNNAGYGDYFNKVDIVPSANKYLQELRNEQIIVMTKIIRGEEPVEYYDSFASFWNSQGGAELTKEANEVKVTADKIYQSLGI